MLVKHFCTLKFRLFKCTKWRLCSGSLTGKHWLQFWQYEYSVNLYSSKYTVQRLQQPLQQMMAPCGAAEERQHANSWSAVPPLQWPLAIPSDNRRYQAMAQTLDLCWSTGHRLVAVVTTDHTGMTAPCQPNSALLSLLRACARDVICVRNERARVTISAAIIYVRVDGACRTTSTSKASSRWAWTICLLTEKCSRNLLAGHEVSGNHRMRMSE